MSEKDQANIIHDSAVISPSAQLAGDVIVGPNCVIGDGVKIGKNNRLGPNVVISGDVVIGDNNQLFANCVIGGQPQILGSDENMPRGRLVIGNGNTFREQVTIHPSIYEDKETVVGNDNLLMIGCHIGHDCVLQDKLVLSNYVQISGHCKIETGVWLSGVVLVHQFITIGKWCYAAGMAGINKDVPPFTVVSGHYPPQIRGINKRGLARAGYSDQQQKNIVNAYRRLYRNGGSLLENAKQLAEEDIDENVRAMVEAIIKSSSHRMGRYLESFR